MGPALPSPPKIAKLKIATEAIRLKIFCPLKSLLRRFLAEDGGTTTTEYALVAILISVAIVASVTAIGTKLSANYYGPISGNL